MSSLIAQLHERHIGEAYRDRNGEPYKIIGHTFPDTPADPPEMFRVACPNFGGKTRTAWYLPQDCAGNTHLSSEEWTLLSEKILSTPSPANSPKSPK